MIFDNLRPELKKYLANRNITTPTHVQELVIPRIFDSENGLLISSPTLSGKTEAIFLPIFNDFQKCDKLIHVSPLKALINDQVLRLNAMTADLPIKIDGYHGDVNQKVRERVYRGEFDVLVITPESLEILLKNRYNKNTIFSNVKKVLVDEVHSYLGTERGYHLSSLIFRLSSYTESNTRIIAISATIDDFTTVNKIFGRDFEVIISEHELNFKHIIKMYNI